MADRFRRQYLSAIRTLRDYRRYGPVIVQNAGQVNIAADGGQQVNVKRGKGGKKTAKAGRRKKANKPKELSAPKRTINLEPAAEAVLAE